MKEGRKKENNWVINYNFSDVISYKFNSEYREYVCER